MKLILKRNIDPLHHSVPQHGSTRIRRKFLWLPKVVYDRVNNCEYVFWLCRVWVEEEFHDEWVPTEDGIEVFEHGWRLKRFGDTRCSLFSNRYYIGKGE